MPEWISMKILDYLYEWYFKKSRLQDKRDFPYVINFPITDNCDSQCVMCNVWKDKTDNELSASEIGEIFQDPLYKEVKHIGISGGEPTLRKDLPECIESILSSLPKLQSLSITSHGYHTDRWEKMLPSILQSIDKYQISFSVNLSVDGIGQTHDIIRGTNGAFVKMYQTLKLLKKHNVKIQIQCTISKDNIYHVGKVLNFAIDKKVEVIFRRATTIARLYNDSIIDDIILNKHENSYLADFFLEPKLHNYTVSPSRRMYYKHMAKLLSVNRLERTFPCYFQNEGLFLTSKGELYNCSVSPNELGKIRDTKNSSEIYWSKDSDNLVQNLKNTTCKKCLHDQNGAWTPYELFNEMYSRSFIKKPIDQFLKVIQGITALFTIFYYGQVKLKPEIADDNSILLIGAYGGEHVGDAAILGGVIQRLQKDFSIDKVTVSSFRPDRTQRWVDELDFNINIEVISDEQINKNLDKSQYLAYAGGPLMDMPLHLANHLKAMSRAKAMGKKVIIEGVGIGPLGSKLSYWLVNKMLNTADNIRVRTKDSWQYLLSQNLNVKLDRDPAFDYLESRVNIDKNKMPLSLIKLLGDETSQNNKKLVAINLRPLWSKYSTDSTDLDTLENSLYEEIVQSFIDINEHLNKEVIFIFFPMNPDQYGFSDLESAYKLEKKLNTSVDFRIWEYEPGIDEMLNFLNLMDAVISMRFHGCIFSLTQNPFSTIGIDYQVGKKGKVSELMEDCNLHDYVSNMKNLKSNWLTNKIIKCVNENTSNT